MDIIGRRLIIRQESHVSTSSVSDFCLRHAKGKEVTEGNMGVPLFRRAARPELKASAAPSARSGCPITRESRGGRHETFSSYSVGAGSVIRGMRRHRPAMPTRPSRFASSFRFRPAARAGHSCAPGLANKLTETAPSGISSSTTSQAQAATSASTRRPRRRLMAIRS